MREVEEALSHKPISELLEAFTKYPLFDIENRCGR
jgi:hypothetical protein